MAGMIRELWDGALAKAVGICLDHAGEHVSRIPVVIDSALKKRA